MVLYYYMTLVYLNRDYVASIRIKRLLKELMTWEASFTEVFLIEQDNQSCYMSIV